MEAPRLRTQRLALRPWSEGDLAPFAALNADPRVMEHFPAPLTAGESDAFAERIAERFEQSGWGLWAVEVLESQEFVGYVGLWPADFVAPGTVEVGWRLAATAWGRGYAPEAAREVLRFGFEVVGLEEIVSFTVPANDRSRRVMDKIGLSHSPKRDFEHPRVDAVAHPHLVEHVLHSTTREQWEGGPTPIAGAPAGGL